MFYSMMITMVTIRLPAETQQQLVGYTGSVTGLVSLAVTPFLSQSKHQPLPWGCAASAMGRTCRRAWESRHWWTALLELP